MTDQHKDAGSAGTPEDSQGESRASPTNKAFWAGIGIGSAALVAALMYAKRPRTKKRT